SSRTSGALSPVSSSTGGGSSSLPSTEPNCHAEKPSISSRGMNRASLLDKGFILGDSPNHDLAFVGQAACDLENLLLLVLDLRQAHRPARFEVVAQILGRTRGHVAQNELSELVGHPLERDDEHVAGDLLEHELYGAAVQLGQVLEG